MSDPFIGEIKLMAFSFAPRNYAFCDGQIVPISQNPTLFSLLDSTFGGNGVSTFGLPDLRGRTPVGGGASPLGSYYNWGLAGGTPTVTLQQAEMPSHGHTVAAVTEASTAPDPGAAAKANSPNPVGNMLASMDAASDGKVYTADTGPMKALSPKAVSSVGGGQHHNNLQPYLATNFCIALQGMYPSRN